MQRSAATKVCLEALGQPLRAATHEARPRPARAVGLWVGEVLHLSPVASTF